jgi:hypothetical protein
MQGLAKNVKFKWQSTIVSNARKEIKTLKIMHNKRLNTNHIYKTTKDIDKAL